MMIPQPPSSTLFPYTTLFRSRDGLDPALARQFDERDRLEHRFRVVAKESGIRDGVFAPSCPAHALQERRLEEHTSELQSLAYLVCRLLLEKKKTSLADKHARA